MRRITLSEDAYAGLVSLRRGEESFSDVVRRLTGANLLRRLVGSMDPETADHYRDAIARGRRRDR